MTHSLKKVDPFTYDVQVELGSAELRGYVSEAEQFLGSQLTIDGFRPGKAPREVVREKIGEQRLREEALQRAVSRSLADVARAEDLDIIDQADFKVEKNNTEELSYRVRVSVIPPVDLAKYTGLGIHKKDVSVTQDEINTALDEIRQSRATFREEPRPAQREDRVEANFSILLDGKQIEGGESQNHPFIIGKNSFVPGFDEQIIGLSAGQKKNFQLSLPSDFYQKNIAGKTVDIDLELVKVESAQVPELNDAFAQSLGRFKSVAELHQNVQRGLLAEKEEKEKERVQLEIIDKIISDSTLPVPPLLVERQLEGLVANFDRSLHQRGLELGLYLAHIQKTQDELKESWRPQALRQVQINLIMRHVAKDHAIDVSDQDVEHEAKGQLESFVSRKGSATEDIKNIDVDALKQNIYTSLLRRKIFDFLEKENVVI